MTLKALREAIKSGELHPDEAIALVREQPYPSVDFIQWASTTGRARFEQGKAAKKKRKKERPQKGDRP